MQMTSTMLLNSFVPRRLQTVVISISVCIVCSFAYLKNVSKFYEIFCTC